MSALAERLQQTLEALTSIEARLQQSLDRDSGWFPATADSLTSNDPDAARARDALLQRFQQTSDHLLRKLFPRLLSAIEGQAEPRPFVDVIEGLHRFGVIDDPDQWANLNELRNRLIHDYALAPGELARDLNAAWDISPLLIAQLARVRTYVDEHKLLGKE